MEEKFKLEIERVTNGFIVQGISATDLPYKEIVEEKEECKEGNLEELRSIQTLFYKITNYFGVYNNKHNKYRLEIKVTDQKGNEIDDIGELNE